MELISKIFEDTIPNILGGVISSLIVIGMTSLFKKIPSHK